MTQQQRLRRRQKSLGSRKVPFPVKKVNMLAAELTATNLQRNKVTSAGLPARLPAVRCDVAMDDEFSYLGILERDP